MAIYAAKSGLLPALMGLVGLPHASPKRIKLLKPSSSFLLLSFMLYPSFERNPRAKDGAVRRINVWQS
jgi:hypothetical protein